MEGREELGYTVKSGYLRLKGGSEGENDTVFKKLWKSKVAQVTAWRVLVNKLVTKANLEKRGITVKSCMCSLCGVVEETSTHLFFECKFSWVLWNQCCVWLGVQSASHNDPLLNLS